MKFETLKKSLFFALCLLVLGVGCASNKGKPTRVDQTPTDWDHETIRKVREAESAERLNNPGEDENSEDDSQCRILTATEAKRGRVSGCRPLDPRSGHGPNAVCCPAQP